MAGETQRVLLRHGCARGAVAINAMPQEMRLSTLQTFPSPQGPINNLMRSPEDGVQVNFPEVRFPFVGSVRSAQKRGNVVMNVV